MCRQISLIAILLLALAAAASAQSFTWTGWFGPEGTDPSWGGHWTYDNQILENGWGHQWYYWEDPTPHFPSLASSVLIPDGVSVDTYGGGVPYCGSLTVGLDALLQIQYENLNLGGPTLHNDGRIELTAGGGTASGLYLQGPLSIEGTGDILLAPGRIFSDVSAVAVTVGAGQFIHGDGQLGSLPFGAYHGIALTNFGHIQATSTTATLDIFGATVHNRGTAEAAAGATLRICGDWDNAGGEILATDGVVWLMPDAAHAARIEGGVLRTVGAGEIQPEGYGSLKNVTVDGLLHLRRYTSVHMSDTITNVGYIKQGVDGWAGGATVIVDSALTFAGDGLVRMGAGTEIKMYDWPTATALVTNGPDHTIECLGGAFGAAPNYYGDQRIELLNEGTLICRESSYACAFHLTGSGFENRGLLRLEPAASVNPELWGAFLQTAGKTEVDDTFIAYEGPFAFAGGILAGQGGLQGAVTASGDVVIHPGDEHEIGQLDIWGPLTVGDGVTLVCEWAHNLKDRLAVHGVFTSTGSQRLRIEYLEIDPVRAADYAVIECDEHVDTADWTVELPDGWSYDTLEWVGEALVVRGLTGMATGVSDVPAATALLGAAPNPFNPRTTVRFALERAGSVRLWVADLRGHRVRTLVDGERPAGTHAAVWEGCDDAGRALGSGTYLCILEVDGRRESRPMTLVR
ncbi:MAG: FlgD immunoglobulin-like domain containing protein [Candidatus Krumholzibacteriia bacterium]